MSIMWKYLDKRSATIAAIKDYDAMQFIINSTDDEIKRTYEKMTSVGSPKWDGMPHAHNPKAGEERLISAISEIDILRERYRQAVEYMDWFKPAWEKLSEELENPQAAKRIIHELRSAAEDLQLFPRRGRPLDALISVHTEYRYLPCENYCIFYLEDEENVVIVRILHQRQDYLHALFG